MEIAADLTEIGRTVKEAGTATEALNLRAAKGFDLLTADVGRPGLREVPQRA